MHSIWHAGILLPVAVVSAKYKKRKCCKKVLPIRKYPKREKGSMFERTNLCWEGYLLGEYMLPSLFAGPRLFWPPGGPILPSIPIKWSGLGTKWDRFHQHVHHKQTELYQRLCFRTSCHSQVRMDTVTSGSCSGLRESGRTCPASHHWASGLVNRDQLLPLENKKKKT